MGVSGSSLESNYLLAHLRQFSGHSTAMHFIGWFSPVFSFYVLQVEIIASLGAAVVHLEICTALESNQRAARPLNEVKLLIVGRGQSGKSSLRDRLVFGTFNPQKPETPGIQIHPWSLPCGQQTVLVRVWDFAGQEITHATHQFFQTERSVYMLVLDTEIRRELEDADVFVFLVSTPFLSSRYIRGVEMVSALKRRAVGETELVAVILEAIAQTMATAMLVAFRHFLRSERQVGVEDALPAFGDVQSPPVTPF
jgi:hypothetical protein